MYTKQKLKIIIIIVHLNIFITHLHFVPVTGRLTHTPQNKYHFVLDGTT